MKTLRLVLYTIIIIVALWLRLHNLAGRAPFEWDQARDQAVVAQMLETHRPVLVGPVVQGEGGFMLGPLYYYLLLPVHLFSSGNPLVLPLTSIILDVLFISLLLVLSPSLKKGAFPLALLWALSPGALTAAQISWNFSLIPLYLLGSVLLLNRLNSAAKPLLWPIFAFWFGLSWHVHPTVIPLIPLVIYSFRRHLPPLSFKLVAVSVLAFLLPLTPLFVFELRHQFLNTHLLFKFAFARDSAFSVNLVLIQEISLKLVRSFSSLFLGKEYVGVGSLVLIPVLFSLFRAKSPWANWLKSYFFLILIGLFFLGDPDFATYYLFPLSALLIWYLFSRLSASRFRLFTLTLVFSLLFPLYLFSYDFSTLPYSLSKKEAVITELALWSNPVDLHYVLPVGRRSGLDWYVTQHHLISTTEAKNVAIIMDTTQEEVIAPEKARSIVLDKRIGGYRLIGFAGAAGVQ